jgi:hypothetical protein
VPADKVRLKYWLGEATAELLWSPALQSLNDLQVRGCSSQWLLGYSQQISHVYHLKGSLDVQLHWIRVYR